MEAIHKLTGEKMTVLKYGDLVSVCTTNKPIKVYDIETNIAICLNENLFFTGQTDLF